MTPERRAELREAVQKMTPGPWDTDPEYEHEQVLGGDGVIVADSSTFPRTARECRANASGIALLKNNAQDLLDAADERDRLREENTRLREAATAIDRFLDGWCPTQCSCASRAEPLHRQLRAALTKDQT